MLRKNFQIATFVFFAWLGTDTIASLAFDRPLPGIYYPMARGTHRSLGRNWTQRSRWGAPLFLTIFGGLWWFFLRRLGSRTGLRAAALITAFLMAPFWVVSLVSADLYDLDLNGFWLASMAYANAWFFLYGLLGTGAPGICISEAARERRQPMSAPPSASRRALNASSCSRTAASMGGGSKSSRVCLYSR